MNKQKVTRFIIFCSRAWDRIPFCKECIFVGYKEGVNGYMLLYTNLDTIFIQGSVNFE
jgi:hypothetical protein